jgi:hypothetical protein
MEVPAEVMIHNELVGMKGNQGTLLTISPHGYYEVNVRLGPERLHRVLLPIAQTVLFARQAEEVVAEEALEIER